MSMRNRLKKHSLKFVSIFLALFLWVYVLNSEKVKFEKTVSLEYILPPEMVFAEKPPQEVVFMIEGPRAFVRTVAERDDKLIIDLNRAKAKRELTFTVDIIPTQLQLPFGMIVERVLPRKIQIKLERRAGKVVSIRPQFVGQLPAKVGLTDAAIVPPEVEVYGPHSIITKLKEVHTRPIDLADLAGGNQFPVEILLNDPRLTLSDPFQKIKITYQLKASKK